MNQYVVHISGSIELFALTKQQAESVAQNLINRWEPDLPKHVMSAFIYAKDVEEKVDVEEPSG